MDLEVLNNQAHELFKNKQFKEALDLLTKHDLPDEIKPNLAKCYYYTSQADKALEIVEPLANSTELWIDTALYHNALGNHKKAFEIYKSLDQSNLKVKFNLGWHFLRDGDFKKGFDYLQHGDKSRVWGHEYIHLENGLLQKEKRWNGQFTDTLLFMLEGGLGDEIIFFRWANYLTQFCNNLIISCNDSLLRLLTNCGFSCVPNTHFQHVKYTAYVPAMTLPAIANIDNPKHHVTFPYIESFTDKFIVNQVDQRANGRKKIGVKFFGNPMFEHDQFRTPPREALTGLDKFGQLFSLQIDEPDNHIPNCQGLIRDWQDTYSVFKSLDVLVTSCTSTAHLAGAMGTRAFVLVPLVPYFVWASNDLPWYGNNITVIRQTKYNDWSTAVEKLYHEISKI